MAYTLSGLALALALAYAGESEVLLVLLANHRSRLSGYGFSGSIAVSTQSGLATPTKKTTGYY